MDENSPGLVSHEQQLARCRDMARQHTFAEPTVLEDWGRSGGEGLEHRRSAYQQLRDSIASGRVQWVVSYDLSRLSRSTKETLDLVDHAQKHGARIHVGDLGILEPSDPFATFSLTTMAAVNKMYRDDLAKRSRESAMARKAAGLPVGRPPYGSRPGEDVAAVLAAFHDAGAFHDAARALNAAGVPTRTGAGWTAKTVHRVVRREEPSALPKARRVRSSARHALNGLLLCHCGRRMQIQQRNGKANAVCGYGLDDLSHPRPIWKSTNLLMSWIKAEAAHLQAPESVEQEIAADETARAQALLKRDRIIDAYTDGVIDKVARDRRLADVDQALDQLQVRIETVDLPTIEWDHDDPSAINDLLLAIWRSVQLDATLRPVSADWRVPQWRAQ
ncbi:MAG: recombinase family protein [Chloroflexi bacterium]|nr:recombinase family protein [Chloroflexota bacterium]